MKELMIRFLQVWKQKTYYGLPWKQVAELYSQFTCKKKKKKKKMQNKNKYFK